MLTYDEAIARILASTSPLPPADSPLLDSLGLTLAEDVAAPMEIPRFANSAMDGFAVRAVDIADAAPDRPVSLPITGEVAAGSVAEQALAPHTAMRIMTGAPVPQGADTIVPLEDADCRDDAVDIRAAFAPGRFIRAAGEDVAAGDVVAARDSIMRPAEIGICAAIGRTAVPVHPAPKVAIISTGDELAEPGSQLRPGQIYNSNSYALAAQVREAGGVVIARHHARDDKEALREAFDACQGADVILTSGAISVGDHDHVKAVFAERGHIDFWRIAIRPGKPFAFGTWGDTRFFGLPGNPVSSMVTFELFVRPALLKMRGAAEIMRPMAQARLTQDARHEAGRQSYQRAFVTRDGDGFLVHPVGKQGSHQMRSMVLANALLILPAHVETVCADEFVTVLLLGSAFAL